jgi:hypothetical protein
MAGTDVPAADERPELADAARLAGKLLRRAARSARSADQPLRRVLLGHLGPGAATLPTVYTRAAWRSALTA